jgi:hypothetical protein
LSESVSFFLLIWSGNTWLILINFGYPSKLFKELIVSPSAVIVYLENIGFVYPAMSMMVIGPSVESAV